MQIGRVTGTVVATRRAQGLDGIRLLIVQPLSHDLRPSEPLLCAVDTVRAGPGDLVSFVTAREAAQALDDDFVPVDAAIVGVIDNVSVPAGARDRAR